jgi:hypothetical protein
MKMTITAGLLTAFVATATSSAFACTLSEAEAKVIAQDGINAENHSMNSTDNIIKVGNASVVVSMISTLSPEGMSCTRLVACHPEDNSYEFLARQCGK